jgi:hypothetical protein
MFSTFGQNLIEFVVVMIIQITVVWECDGSHNSLE